MKKLFLRRGLILIVSANLVFLQSCQIEPTSTSFDTSPSIPSLGTMTVDFSLFNVRRLSLTKSNTTQPLPFFMAASLARIIKGNIFDQIAVPVSATAAMTGLQPASIEDGTFIWRYTDPVAQSSFELTATVNAGKVVWSMYLTRSESPVFDHFLLYYGINDIEASEGFWQFYDDSKAEELIPSVSVDWKYHSEQDRALRFTKNKPDSQKNGSFIDYTVAGSDVTAFYYDVQDGSATISWDNVTGEGYIHSPFYNRGQKSCWDAGRNTVECL